MKSIKEKAKEYGLFNPDIHYDADGNTYDDVDKPSMDFDAGANYVIEQIEDILTHPRRYVNSDTSEEEAMLSDIAKLIEQLKEQ